MIGVIVNPIAGKGRTKELLPEIQAFLTQAALPYSIQITKCPGDGVACAKEALAQGCDRVLCIGGDGTAREIAEGLCGSACVLGIVPAGTGNDFARTFSLPVDPEDALKAAVFGPAKPIDVFVTDNGVYINICSIGLDSDAAYNAAKVKRLAGKMCYLVGALFAVLRRKIYRYSLSLDDAEEIEQRNMLTAFCNGRYYGGGFYPVPGADPSDGWMDVLTVEPNGAFLHTLPLLANNKKGTHIHHKQSACAKSQKDYGAFQPAFMCQFGWGAASHQCHLAVTLAAGAVGRTKRKRKQYEHRYPNPPLLTGIHPGAASARPAIPRGRRRTECPAWPAGRRL